MSRELVRDHAERLAAARVPSPELDAALLTRHVLGADPRTRRSGPVDLPPASLARLERLVEARARRVPLQHLTGEVGFRTLVLRCRPGVFVPRPETEVVAGAAVTAARAAGPAPVVVEPCSGSGAIALSVAAEVPGANVVASDADDAAVALARENLSAVTTTPGLARGASCTVVHGDLLEPVPSALRGAVDVLVVNPPYLTPAEVAASEPEVRDHDPRGALIGGVDGNEIIVRLLSEAPSWLRSGGTLVLEVAEQRGDEIADLARDRGYVDVRLGRDLAGRIRYLHAHRPATDTRSRATEVVR